MYEGIQEAPKLTPMMQRNDILSLSYTHDSGLFKRIQKQHFFEDFMHIPHKIVNEEAKINAIPLPYLSRSGMA